jgi:hypothetical protein
MQSQFGFVPLLLKWENEKYNYKIIEDRAAQLEKLKKSREKRKALETFQERNLRLQQMKENTKRLISIKTSQDKSIRLKDAANLT